ncbi:MAG: O-antigen ligase family protein [Patescibacteria group bacterium]|nr:O-antigen ligase family protein [Patescibacteria group bacterium]
MLIKNKTLLIIALAFLTLASGLLISYFNILALGIIFALCFFIFGVLLIFKNPFYGVLLITFFLPFEHLGTLEVGRFTLKINHIFGLITILAWTLTMLIRKKVKFEKLPIAVPLLIFIVINILSFTQAVNFFRAVTVFIFTLFSLLISLAVVNLVRNQKHLDKLIKVLFISAFIVSLFGLFQFVGDLIGLPESITGLRDLYTKEVFGFPRVHSTALEPLYFANYLIIPIMLCLAFLLSKKRKIKWYWLLILLVLMLTNFVLALSRAAYIALAFAFIFILIIYFKRFFSLKRLIIILLVLLAVYGIFTRVFGLTEDFPLYVDRFATQATNLFSGASFSDRAQTFEKAWQMFKERPWLGVGTGNFGPNVAWYPLVTPPRGWLIVNNIFLEIMAETGIFGFLSFISILVILFLRSIKALVKTKNSYLKAIMAGLLAAFVGVIVQYQTFSILYIIHIWFLFGLMIAVQNIILKNSQKNKESL